MMLRSLLFRNLRERSGLGDTWDGSTGSVISIGKDRNRWFLFRIIPRGSKGKYHPNTHKIIFDKHQGVACDDGISLSTTPSGIIPMSFIQIDDNNCVSTFLKHRNTSTNVIDVQPVLNVDDSITSYLRYVDSAYEKLVLPNVDNTDEYREDYNYTGQHYTSEDINQGISVLTMDPALLYTHSIIVDEFSWLSFCQGEHDEYDDVDINYDNIFDEKCTVPDPYYEI